MEQMQILKSTIINTEKMTLWSELFLGNTNNEEPQYWLRILNGSFQRKPRTHYR